MTEETRNYGPKFDEALAYATELHRTQFRKSKVGDGAPYITHLLGVAALVGAHGGSEEQVIAALLHDAIEDQFDNTLGDHAHVKAEIRERFGERVLQLVEACTDSEDHDGEPWKKRKNAYLAALRKKPAGHPSLLVAVADKLYNARAILRDLRLEGTVTLERFNGGIDGTLWYYRTLADVFVHKEAGGYLAEELQRTVAQMEHCVETSD